jgi:hypothetical protein
MSNEDQFDDLREVMREIEHVCDKGVAKLACMSTEGLPEAELRERLESIRKCLVTRDGAREVLANCLAGHQGAEEGTHVLETLKWQIVSFSGVDDDA